MNFELDRTDMAYKVTAKHWLEEKEDGWYVGQRINDESRFTLHGPCDSKLVAEILKAEMIDAFEMMAQNAIDRFTKRSGSTS